MKTAALWMLILCGAAAVARADFSYTTTRKMEGPMAGMAGAAANQPSKTYFKGQKMMVQNGDTSMILDFDAQTITNINNVRKTVTVRPFSTLNAAASQTNTKIDVKETGQTKTINGYNARELIMTVSVNGQDAGRAGGMQMQMEMDMWFSSDPPGVGQMREFYQRNASRFPWTAMAQGNPSMQKAMADIQRKMADMNGIPVLQVMKMNPAGGAAAPAMPQMTPEQMEQMKAAMARMPGGPQGPMAQAMMARMGAMSGSSAGGPMMQVTMESTGFSTSSIPDSVFAIPAGYQTVEK